MKKNTDREIPLDQILNITKELNPDDFEADGEIGDLRALVEQKDDYNPDDLDAPKMLVSEGKEKVTEDGK